MTINTTRTNKVILMYGRFSEKIDGTPIIDIPLCDPSNEGNWMGWTKKDLEEKAVHSITTDIQNSFSLHSNIIQIMVEHYFYKQVF